MYIIYVITSAIKIFFLVFLGKAFFSKKEGCSTKIIIFSVLIGYVITNFLNMPTFVQSAPSSSSPKRKCFANQRYLLGVVENYNMDAQSNNYETIKSLDSEAIVRLLEKRYLKENPNKNYKDCEYLSKGDLTNNGFIYCKKHGDISQRVKEIEEIEEIKEPYSSLIIFFNMVDIWVEKIITILFFPITFLVERSEIIGTVLILSLTSLGLCPYFVFPQFSHFLSNTIIGYTLSGFFYALILFFCIYLCNKLFKVSENDTY